MKKMMLPLFALVLHGLADAQKLKMSQVPEAVRDSLNHLYPSLQKINWEQERGNFEAGFMWHGRKKSITFDSNGNWQEKETTISLKAFPTPALTYLREKFPGVTIKEVTRITRRDGTKNFEVELKGEDYLFNEQGEFLQMLKD